jgi:hypothetical protein
MNCIVCGEHLRNEAHFMGAALKGFQQSICYCLHPFSAQKLTIKESAAAIVYESVCVYLKVCLFDVMDIGVPLKPTQRATKRFEDFWYFGSFGVDFKTEIGVNTPCCPSGTSVNQLSAFHCGSYQFALAILFSFLIICFSVLLSRWKGFQRGPIRYRNDFSNST